MSEKRPLPDAQSGGSQPAPKKSRFDKPAGNAAPTAAGIPAAEAAPASNAASVLARAKTALLNKGNLQAKLENLKKLKSKLQAKPLAAAVATNAVMKAQKPTVASGLAAPAPVTLPAPAALPATGSGVRQAALQKAAQLQTSLGIRPAGMPAAGPLAAAAAAASAAATSMTEPGPATVLTQAAAAAERPGPAKAEAGMEEEEKVDAFFDPRMAPRTQTGERRRGAGLDFHRPGRLQREAERERFKKAFGKDWKEQLAHKRRMERKAARMKEDANLVPIGERKKTAEAEEAQEEEELRKQEEQELEEMPEVEWWDALLLDRPDDYPVADDDGGDGHGRLLRSVLEAAALLPSMDGATTDGAAMEVDGADANGIAAPREPMGWVSAEVCTELEAAVQALAKPKLWKALELEEHPVLIEPPLDAEEAMPQALKLTKKELKKMRKQRREAREKEKQDMIRQGMLEAPKAKVRISNMMRVLRTETVADPTAMEQEVRRQMTERQAAHDDRNLARSLTPAERKAKKMRKLFDGPVPGGEEEEEEGGEGAAPAQAVVVSLYRLGDLKHKLNRIKVHMNATENHMTGRALWVDAGEAAGTGTGSQQPFSLVVVEGGNKATKRYAKLMLRRIDWAADYEGKDHQAMPNQCCLVWQGEVKDAAFKEFKVEKLATSTAAKKLLVDAGVGEYWDLAKNFDPVTAGPEVV